MPSSGFQTSALDRKSTRLNSSHTIISYAVFCLKKEEVPRRARITPLWRIPIAGRALQNLTPAAQRRGELGQGRPREGPLFFYKVWPPPRRPPLPQPVPLRL